MTYFVRSIQKLYVGVDTFIKFKVQTLVILLTYILIFIFDAFFICILKFEQYLSILFIND